MNQTTVPQGQGSLRVMRNDIPQFMPRWSPISQWCRQLGRMGIGNHANWMPRFSIYNTGNPGPLYYLRGVPPFVFAYESSPWEVLRLKSEDPNPKITPGQAPGTCLGDIGVHFLSRDIAGPAYLKIVSGGKEYFDVISPGYFLHAVQVSGRLRTVVEHRPLPLTFYFQALSRP